MHGQATIIIDPKAPRKFFLLQSKLYSKLSIVFLEEESKQVSI
jgi:hypothetical protein